MLLRHPAIAFDNQIAQTYRIAPKSKHTSQTLLGPQVFFSEQSLGIFHKSGKGYSWQREYIEGYDAAADDDDVHLQCSCCCHRRSSLNGQVGCRASRSRDNWSCQHNLRITSSPGFSRDTIASWAHYIFSHQPTSWLWTNRTLSTLQVLTKLASLDPSHTLRVPTSARCVVPSGRFL